jgi:uncharacterized protein (TIGR03067 family)
LQAILDKYPKLLEAKRGQVLGKPSRGDEYTPLQTAAAAGTNEAVEVLIQKQADVNAATGLGYTPLHLAAERGHIEIVKRLVKAGAKLDAKTTAFPAGFVPGGPPDEAPQRTPPIPARTALQIAEDLEHTTVVAFLRTVTDQAALAGTWQVIEYEVKLNGRSDPAAARVEQIVIDGEKITLVGTAKQSLTFEIDPASTPKRIEVYYLEEMKLKAHVKGIYALDRDTLQLCLPLSLEADRPQAFAADNCTHYVLKRKQ